MTSDIDGIPLEYATWGPERLRPVPDAFRFAGVAFELERAPDRPPLQLPSSLGEPVAEPCDWPVAARVRLFLARDASLPRERSRRQFQARRNGAVLELHTGRGTARVERTVEGGYRGTAAVAPDTYGSAEQDLLHGLAVAVASREGAALLHAAAAELDGGVCAFLGPPDAGKSTARDLVAGGRVFAIDRILVVLRDGVAWAWSVPGGIEDESSLPVRSRQALPLRWLLRVVQGVHTVSVRRVPPARAAMVVRAAIHWPFGDAAGELEAMDVAARIASRALVGEIETVLSQSNTEAIRRLEHAS